VQQKAAQELIDGQRQQPLLVGMGGVSPAEGDVALFEGDESVVGDGDAVGVAAEITQRMFRSAEGWLGIDDPVVAEEGSAPSGKARGSTSGARSPWNSSWLWRKTAFSPSSNLPRKTSLSTSTCRKKLCRDGIQRMWSGARPPAAATQWT
jgi:hypothetical protein